MVSSTALSIAIMANRLLTSVSLRRSENHAGGFRRAQMSTATFLTLSAIGYRNSLNKGQQQLRSWKEAGPNFTMARKKQAGGGGEQPVAACVIHAIFPQAPAFRSPAAWSLAVARTPPQANHLPDVADLWNLSTLHEDILAIIWSEVELRRDWKRQLEHVPDMASGCPAADRKRPPRRGGQL
jgi:hypothetical protein